MTVRQLVRKSLLLIGAISSAETVGSTESTDALETINNILQSWSLSGHLIYSKTIETFSLVASQASYTIGVGGNFNTTNPVMIEQASIVDNSVEYPLEIISSQEYAQISSKTLTSQLPSSLYFNRGVTTSTIYLYPIASTANQIKLYSLKPFTEFTTISDTVSLPTGYENALKYALAVKLAPEYGKMASPDVVKEAINSKRELERINTDPLFLSSDLMGAVGSGNTYSIYKGE